VTVVIGVVTVTLVGVVTATVVIGVLMVTVAATVTGNVVVGTLGTETVGTPSVEDTGDGAASAVDEPTDAGVASAVEDVASAVAVGGSAVEPWVDARTALTLERSTPPGVRPTSTVRPPERVAGAAAAVSVPLGATTRAATTPVVARPAAATTAAAPFATATCGMPACFSQRHNPMPPAVTPSV